VEEIFTLNLGRLIFVLIFFLTFFIVIFKTKKYFHYSVLFLLLALPLNITLQQPNFDIYIHGISSNYVIPTLSIIDVFVFFILLFSFKERKNLKISKNTKIFFTVFFLFLTTKAFLDNNLLSTLLIYRMFFYTLCCFCVFQFFDFKKNLKTISFLIFFSILIQLVIGFLQFKTGHSLGLHFLGESNLVKGMLGSSFIDLNGILFLRAYGTFPHPNILAAFSLFAVFFSIANLKKDRINILTSILATILIFLTFSRIAIVLTVFLWFGFLVFKIKEKGKKTTKKKRNTLLFYSPLFFTRFTNLFLEKDSSFSDRLELMKTAKEIFQNHPYFGIGAGRFVYGLDLYPVYTRGGFLLLQPVHNIFALILSEYGFVFGIPVLFLILFLLFKNFLKLNFFFKYLVFSVFVLSFFDHFFLTLPQGLLAFLFLLTLLYKKA
jgi:hypothetical protein